MIPTLTQVKKYHNWRLSCYPFKPASKRESFEDLRYLTWGQFTNTRQTLKEAELLFSDRFDANIAVIGGQPSDNVFFLDADSTANFETMNSLLAGYGITTPIVQRDSFTTDDPHAGGGCFWLRAPVPVKSRKTDKLGIEIRGQGQYVIAPQSIHPTGATYQFLNESPEIFTLPSLDAIPELQLEQATATEGRRKIPRLALSLLGADTEALSRYQTRSEAEAAIIGSLYRAGFSFDMIHSYFIEFPAAGKFRELYHNDPDNALRWLSLTYGKICSYLDAHQSEATGLAKNLTTWALSKSWPGRTGSTDRAVYLAHLEIVQRCGKSEAYAASCRDLAELAGLSWQTVATANHRLLKTRLIKRSDPATPELATRWTLIDAVSSLDTPSHEGVTECQFMKLNQSHDAFRHSGLGKTGAEIYHVLCQLREATPQKLEQVTGRGKATVWRKLQTMQELMMVEVTRPGWYMALDVNLDSVANILGTKGLGKKQRELHIQQRRLHRLELAQG